MASTNSTVDGMGFEELNQVGIQQANLMIAGSVVAGGLGSLAGSFWCDSAHVVSFQSDSDVTAPNVRGSVTGSFTSLRATNIYNTQGQLYPSQVGSPVGYNAVVKAGNVTTSAGSEGFITFGNNFSTNTYYVSVCPGSMDATAALGSGWYVSGLRHKSGCWLIGGPSITYDYIAVGVI